MIIHEALALDLCRSKYSSGCRNLWSPIIVFENLAFDIIYAFPLLKERVVEICNKRLSQRQLERAEFNRQYKLDEEKYLAARRLSCPSFSSSFGSLSYLETGEEARAKAEQAGHPVQSCSELRYFLELLPRVGKSGSNGCHLGRLMRQRLESNDEDMLVLDFFLNERFRK